MEFHSLAEPLGNKIFRFLFVILKSEEEARDLAQETLIKLWVQTKSGIEISNMEAWTFRVARNMAMDKLKSYHARNTRGIMTVDNNMSHQASPDFIHENKELGQLLENTMQQLPELQRDTLHLRDVEGYSYDQIADMLDCSLGQVKTSIFRARQKMKELLVKNEAYER